MLTTQRLAQLSIEDLKRRLRFHHIALTAVWFGAAIAIGATAARLIIDGFFAYETVSTALLAILVSIPVYQQKRKIAYVLRKKY